MNFSLSSGVLIALPGYIFVMFNEKQVATPALKLLNISVLDLSWLSSAPTQVVCILQMETGGC